MTGRGVVIIGALGLLAGGCAKGKSFARVSVLTTTGEMPDVVQLLVDIDNSGSHDNLKYPKTAASTPLRLDDTNPVTLSVGFEASRLGPLTIGVTPMSATMALGFGMETVTIDSGHTVDLTVRVAPGATPPPKVDGGVGDGPSGKGDAGPCSPTTPGSCSGNQTCVVLCKQETGVPVCTAGGMKKPGETCLDHDECAPGSQCFKFYCDSTTASASMCLRYCVKDEDCIPGGRCMTGAPVECMGKPVSYRLCSRPCDPVALTGCPKPLTCFLYADEIPDCGCPDPMNRTGGNGASCIDSRQCQPKFTCVNEGGAQGVCRELCRLPALADTCPTNTRCEMLKSPDLKIYGACLAF